MSVTLESVTMTRTYFVAQTYSLGKNGCVSRLHPLSMYTHPRAVPQAIVLNRVTVGGHNSLQKIFFVMENGFFLEWKTSHYFSIYKSTEVPEPPDFFALCATPTKVWNSSLAWVKLWQKFEEEATDKKEVEVSLFPCPFVGSDTSLSFDIFFWVVFDSRDTWKAKTINKSSKSLHFYSLEFANPLSFILGRN